MDLDKIKKIVVEIKQTAGEIESSVDSYSFTFSDAQHIQKLCDKLMELIEGEKDGRTLHNMRIRPHR